MSDQGNAGGAVERASAPTGEQRAPTDGSDQSIVTSLLDEGASDGPANGASEATWPENWRELVTSGDEAGMKLAEKFSSPEALWKKLVNQEQVIRRGLHKASPTLPAGATPEQVAEYRKAIGVPEKPEEYGLKFSEGVKPTEADNTLLQNLQQFAHQANIPPAQVKPLFEWYQSEMVRTRQEYEQNFQREFARSKDELRKEYGPDYLKNVRILDEFLDGRPALAELIKGNLNRKQLVKEAIEMARSVAPEESLLAGDSESGGKSLEQELDELSLKSVKRTITPQERERYRKLLAANEERNERRERRRAG